MGSQASNSSTGAERWQLVEVIGRGSFGDVYRGYDTLTGKAVAIKVIDLEDIEEDIAEIQKEISMLKTCRSPNITEYYGSAVVPGTTQLMIVMELMAVSVSELVDDASGGAPLPEPCIAYVLREVLNALVYLHSEHRIHRDVKAANILLSADGRVKVSDFGVSAQLSGTVGKRRTFVGSPLWMAPEVIEQAPETQPPGAQARSDGYDELADIWSLGITAIEMAMGEPPRANVSSFRLLFMIVRDDPPALDGSFSTDFKDFVWRCLRKDPVARPSADELLEHEFVRYAEMPPDFAPRIADFLRRRPALAQQRRSGGGGSAGGGGGGGQYGTITSANYATVPRWDFNGGDISATVRAAPAPATNGSTAQLRESNGSAASVGAGESAADEAAAAAAEAVGEAAEVLTGQFDTVRAAPAAVAAAAVLGAAAGATVVAAGVAAAAAAATRVEEEEQGSAQAASSSALRHPSAPAVPDRPAMASRGTLPAADAVQEQRQAAQDTVPLRTLIEPALASASGPSPAAAAVAADALEALSRLEALRPGASRSMVGDMLALLSVSSMPALQPLKSSAEAVFGGGEGSSKAAAPDLGPLGNYLLFRWRESAARERMAQGGGQYPS